MARGNGTVGRSTGVADGRGDAALAAFGVFAGSGVSFAAAAFDFAVLFFFELGSFFAVDFFLVDLDFADGLGDFFGFGEADAFGVTLGFTAASSADTSLFSDFALGVELGDSFGFGVASWSSDDCFVTALAFGVPLGDSFGFGVASSSSDDGFAFGLALGVTEGVVFAFFALGLAVADGVGVADSDDSVAPALTGSPFRGPSESCPRMKGPMVAQSAKAIVNQMRERATAAQRNRGGAVFKRPAVQARAKLLPRAPARGAKLHSTCRREGERNRSDTSR